MIRSARKKLRKRFPAATELVYDNYNFFVIGYGPNKRPSDAIVSIAAAANGVCFIHGASLADPEGILTGSGKQTVQSLLTRAADAAQTPMPAAGKGKLVIRSISAKQRPRRKKTKKI